MVSLNSHIMMRRVVAAAYLESLTQNRLCITIYFTDKTFMDTFVTKLVDTYSHNISLNKGFDYVTLWSEDPLIIQNIKNSCDKKCLDYSDI